MTKKVKAVERTETPETTNTALQIILKDLDALVEWAEADARINDGLRLAKNANQDRDRARAYRRCRNTLASSFK